MRVEHTQSADLNLLRALAVLLEERHVSRAAERFHLSQSAMSRTLQRLRETFGDELLVRTSAGYELTPRARQLQAELADVLPRLDTMLRGDTFDPATATGEVRVHCTDYATTVLGPGVFRRIFREAPHLSLAVEPLGDHSAVDVELGRADLMISGAMAGKPLRWETLFEEDFVCLLSRDHPVTAGRLTLDDLTRHPHVVVAVLSGEQTMVERRLAALGLRRRAGLRVPYFSAAAAALPGTTLIAVLPRRGAEPYADRPAYRIAEAPAEFAPFPYGIAWHPRVDGDPVNRWLRGIVRQAAAGLGGAG